MKFFQFPANFLILFCRLFWKQRPLDPDSLKDKVPIYSGGRWGVWLSAAERLYQCRAVKSGPSGLLYIWRRAPFQQVVWSGTKRAHLLKYTLWGSSILAQLQLQFEINREQLGRMKLMSPTNKLDECQYSQCKHGVTNFISFDLYSFSNGVLNGAD